MLLSNNVIPVVVFDGGPLPAKKEKEVERRRSREENRIRGESFLRQGNHQAANECFRKAVDVTPEMARQFIRVLNEHNIEYIVAPYEADAQLAFLSLQKYVDCVVTEDSDLIAYGCHRVLFKMDQFGQGKEIRIENLGSTKNPSFFGFTLEKFRYVCILSGCDYLAGIPGLGIKTALELVRKYKTLDKLFLHLRSGKKYPVPAGYEQDFLKADYTFLYQRVFDHVKQEVVTLNQMPPHISQTLPDTNFLGPPISSEIAIQIALGNVNPASKLPFDDVEDELAHLMQEETNFGQSVEVQQDRSLSPQPEINLRSSSPIPSLLPVHKNTVTHYFTPVTLATKKQFIPPRSKLTGSTNALEEEPTNLEPTTEVEENLPIIAPRSPSPPAQRTKSEVIISRYFANKKQNKVSPVDLLKEQLVNFQSPFVNSEVHLSISRKRPDDDDFLNEEFSFSKKRQKNYGAFLHDLDDDDQNLNEERIRNSDDESVAVM